MESKLKLAGPEVFEAPQEFLEASGLVQSIVPRRSSGLILKE